MYINEELLGKGLYLILNGVLSNPQYNAFDEDKMIFPQFASSCLCLPHKVSLLHPKLHFSMLWCNHYFWLVYEEYLDLDILNLYILNSQQFVPGIQELSMKL